MIKTESYPRKIETVYTRLAAAVVERAVMDYRSAVKCKDTMEIKQLKKFFTSDWFALLCDLDGKMLMRRIEAMEEAA